MSSLGANPKEIFGLLTKIQPPIPDITDSRLLREAQSLHQSARQVVDSLAQAYQDTHSQPVVLPETLQNYLDQTASQLRTNPPATANLLAEFIACAAEKPFRPLPANQEAVQDLTTLSACLLTDIDTHQHQLGLNSTSAILAVTATITSQINRRTSNPVKQNSYYRAYFHLLTILAPHNSV